jgi:hypothetical protein
MPGKSALPKKQPRHFGRGWSLTAALATTLMVVACSSSLDNQLGAGSSGTGQGGGGFAGTAAWGTGGGGTGGAGAQSGTGGGGGIASVIGVAGTGGASTPVCASGTPTFSICVVSDADLLPLADTTQNSIPAAIATVEAVGSGTAPAQCQSARVFGASLNSDWWMQVRTTDKVLWTIGVGGLGSAPLVKTGDPVTLGLDYSSGSYRRVQISDSTGVPVVWSGAGSMYWTWIDFSGDAALCTVTRPPYDACPSTRYSVFARVNGSSASLSPFSADYVGGYYVAIGEYATPVIPRAESACRDVPYLELTAAAAKVPQ